MISPSRRVAVVDASRLRREVVAAALQSRGFDATAGRVGGDADLVVILDKSVLPGTSVPLLPIADDFDIDNVAAAVLPVLRGETPPDAPTSSSAPAGGVDLLSPREREVLISLSEGMTNAQIAAALDISDHTARTHVGNVYAKLAVSNRRAAAAVARRAGVVRHSP